MDVTRRRLLEITGSTLAGIGVAGCLSTDSDADPISTPDPTATETPEPTATETPDECPAECPVDTMDGYAPPDELTLERVEELVVAYEEAYALEHLLKPPHKKDAAHPQVESVTRHEHEFVVELTVMVTNWQRREILFAEPVTSSPIDGVPQAKDLDSNVLRDAANQAAEAGERVGVTDFTTAAGDETLDPVPADLREAFDSLPGTNGDRYVTVEGDPIRMWFRTEEFHNDNRHAALYYITPRVIRRGADVDAKPESGELLECE